MVRSGRQMCAALVACATLAACAATEPLPAPVAPAPGELIGRVEIAPGVPARYCRVLLEGAPFGAACDAQGFFDVRQVPPGRWDLRILADAGARTAPALRLQVAANSGFVTDLGALRLEAPGQIGGHVLHGDASTVNALVVVPATGLVGAPDDNGGFLVRGVPPGVTDVIYLGERGVARRQAVRVEAGATAGILLDQGKMTPTIARISGLAWRDDVALGHEGLEVELVDARTSRVVTHTTTSASGAFAISAREGVYVVRVRDGASPMTAIVPQLVVQDAAPLVLATTLHLPAADEDLDGDGVVGADDPDEDGDGVLDADDAFPCDPAESADADHDGLGDRADLSTSGDGRIDARESTPDSDGDGRLDFEDDCPLVADPGQEDRDHDGIGDACDDCPDVPDATGDGCGAAPLP